MFCKYCGTQVDDSAAFCSKCGKQLSETLTGGPSHPNVPSPQPSIHIQNSTIPSTQDTKRIIAIIMSVAALLTSLLTWVKLDLWVIEGTGNLFELLDLSTTLQDYMGTDASSAVAVIWVVIFLSVICAILHGYALYSVIAKDRYYGQKCSTAGIFSAILSVVFIIIVFILKRSIQSELGFGSDAIAYGVGPFICLIISIIESKYTAPLSYTVPATNDIATPISQYMTTCRFCGTKYTRGNYTNICPSCKRNQE